MMDLILLNQNLDHVFVLLNLTSKSKDLLLLLTSVAFLELDFELLHLGQTEHRVLVGREHGSMCFGLWPTCHIQPRVLRQIALIVHLIL